MAGSGRRLVFSALLLLWASAAGMSVPTDQRIYQWRREWEWCGSGHERDPLPGLDDARCAKRVPPHFDRVDWACPARWQDDPAFGPSAANLSSRLPISKMDLDALSSVVDDDIHVAVVVVKRAGPRRIRVRYLGNKNAATPHQPWSSTKILAASAASLSLRAQGQRNVGLASSCRNASSTASTHLSPTFSTFSRVGDLLTTCCSYDTTLGISSNQIGAWFQAVGGHVHADRTLHEWLGAPPEETFGGDYGESISTTRLVNERVLVNTPSSSHPNAAPLGVSLEYPPPRPTIENHMSALTMAEWMRRIVHAREDGEKERRIRRRDLGLDHGESVSPFGMEWEDAETILYGGSNTAASAYTDKKGDPVDLQWGGASMSSDIYLQRAAGINGTSEVERMANGRWRIFSKLGFGYSSDRSQFELALNGYMCLPILNQQDGSSSSGNIHNGGLEFAISMWASDAEHQDDGRALDLRFQQATNNVTQFLLAEYYMPRQTA